MITVVGGGDLHETKGMTARAAEKIRSARRLVFQTCKQKAYINGSLSLDEIFDGAEDFDEFSRKAVEFIGGQGEDTVFVAVGDGVNNNVTVGLCAAYKDVEIIPGHITECVATGTALGKYNGGTITYISAYDFLKARFETDSYTVITGIDGEYLFFDVKARLLDYYPDDFEVVVNGNSMPLEALVYDGPCDLFLDKVPLLRKKRFSYGDLMNIVFELRQKCPWDREQTHKSIATNLIEECYELYEAIDKEDGNMLLEEMGDVLLQVCLHNVFECEHGEVYDDEVTTLIAQKLIRRHPHVYGDAVYQTGEQVKGGWDAIKKQEYSLQTKADELTHISKYLPPLMRAYKTVKKVGKLNIDIKGDIRRTIDAVERGENVDNNCGRLLLLAVIFALKAQTHPYVCLNNEVDAVIEYVKNQEQNDAFFDKIMSINVENIVF